MEHEKINSLVIGNIHYDIEHIDDLIDERAAPLLGRIEYIPQKIYIMRGLTREKEHSVILHEICHGIDEHYGVFPQNKNNEKNITMLAVALHQFMLQNPKLIKSICDIKNSVKK